MIHRSFHSISETVTDPSYKEIYKIIAEREPHKKGVLDSLDPVYLRQDEIAKIKNLMFDKIRTNLVNDAVSFQSLDEAIQSVRKFSNLVKDAFYNPMTGVGVKGIDPGMWDMATIPVSMSPNEATSYYSSGGLPQIIIDKKAKGALLNGYHFECDVMSEADRNKLKEYAQSINFDAALEMATRDGLIYGGAALYPHFKKDDPDTYCLPLNALLDKGIIDKNCIDYFVTVDRWNMIIIPSYNITARDYLNPDTFYIPIGGIRIASKRCAMIKPKKLPYWGALRQLGWGASDFEGYIRSILAYKIIIASVPIMAQQMSLLVHEIPLDGIIAQNGPDAADEFAERNNERMRQWSMLNPVTINSFGKLTAINRSFENYDGLIMSLRQDVAANSGIPESVLFHTLSKGFSDNTEEITLKQSETIKNINNSIQPALQPIVKILVYSCFGKDSDQAKISDRVRLSFESPTVITNEEKGKLLEKFSNGVNMITQSGADLADAVEIAKCFIPEMNIPEDVMNRLKKIENPLRREQEKEDSGFVEEENDNPFEETDENGEPVGEKPEGEKDQKDDNEGKKPSLNMGRAVPVRQYTRYDAKGVPHKVRNYSRGR